jgi:Na+-translocating ferredoxin:NAD+ oxidoreductase RnfE subunit
VYMQHMVSSLRKQVSSRIILNIACCVIQSVVNKSDRLFGVKLVVKFFVELRVFVYLKSCKNVVMLGLYNYKMLK